jgi:RimJ/RimL family protein N-acetyltransferase
MVVGRPDLLEETWRLHNGTPVLLRMLQATDFPLHRRFLYNCSQESIYQRFFQVAEHAKVTDQQIARYTNFDQTRELAIIAVRYPDQEQELGVARLIELENGVAEFAVIVADPWQRQGLGRKLLKKIIEVASQRHIRCLQGYVLSENKAMLSLCRQLGFKVCWLPSEGMFQVHIDHPHLHMESSKTDTLRRL